MPEEIIELIDLTAEIDDPVELFNGATAVASQDASNIVRASFPAVAVGMRAAWEPRETKSDKE